MRLDSPALYVAGGYKVAKRLFSSRDALRHSALAELQALFPDRHGSSRSERGERTDDPCCLEELYVHSFSEAITKQAIDQTYLKAMHRPVVAAPVDVALADRHRPHDSRDLCFGGV